MLSVNTHTKGYTLQQVLVSSYIVKCTLSTPKWVTLYGSNTRYQLSCLLGWTGRCIFLSVSVGNSLPWKITPVTGMGIFIFRDEKKFSNRTLCDIGTCVKMILLEGQRTFLDVLFDVFMFVCAFDCLLYHFKYRLCKYRFWQG